LRDVRGASTFDRVSTAVDACGCGVSVVSARRFDEVPRDFLEPSFIG
jgi:hypothetical protein